MAESSSSGNGSALPLPPGVDVASLVAQAKKDAGDFSPASWVDDLVRKWIMGHLTGIIAVCSQGASMLDDILAPIVKLIGAFQGTNEPGFFTLLAAILSDVMGVDFDIPTVKGAWGKAGSMTGFVKIGQDYLHALLKQLGNPKTLSPEGGIAAAEGFLGYVLGFGVREGNLGLLMSWLPEEWRIFDKLEEYPKAIRQNLGFGRISRQVLHPLIQTLITDPLQWYVNSQYHPKRMGESIAIKAWSMGAVQDADLATELLYAGYAPSLTDILKNEYSGKLTVSDVERLSAAGRMDEQSAIYAIRQSGVQEGTAALMLDAERRRHTDGVIQQLVLDIRNDFLTGYISADERDLLWSKLYLPEIQLPLLQLEANTRAAFPQKRLTLSEVQSAFVEGFVDSTYLQAFLKSEGYSPDDQLTLYYQTLMKLGTEEAKMAVAQYAYNKAVAKAQAKGEAPPPPPPILAGSPLTPAGGLGL